MKKNLSDFYSGSFKKQYGYESFSPSLINVPYKWKDNKIDILLENAVFHIGELNAYSLLVPDIDFFIRMYIFKEAAKSNRIEGTMTEMDDAVMPQEEIKPENLDDWQEVKNYTEAMNYAIKKLETLPVSMRLLKETHKILLTGVRGESRLPGEIRSSQNWIGGSNLNDAYFIPPHHDELPELLADLEKFLHNDNLNIPNLIKTAIAHYQFETIHPFLDGNGRIGRLLITLYLVSKGFLKKPTLYLSDFFEKNKGSYYEYLTIVRKSHKLDDWIKFFLNGCIETAQSGRSTLEKIIKLRQEDEAKLFKLGKRSKTGHNLLKLLYSYPFSSIPFISKELKITHQSVSKIIAEFHKLGVLRETTGYSRNRIFVYDAYMKLFR